MNKYDQIAQLEFHILWLNIELQAMGYEVSLIASYGLAVTRINRIDELFTYCRSIGIRPTMQTDLHDICEAEERAGIVL